MLGVVRRLILAGRTPYLGFVATRGYVPTNFEPTFTTWMTRSYHVARVPITSLRIAVPNFYVNTANQTETGTGGTTTITASVEYPSTVMKQIRFNGAASTTIASGTFVVSDPVAVQIPDNTAFWIRMYMPNASGQVYDGFGKAGLVANGDVCNNFDGDKTLSGTVSSQFAGFMTAPFAIIGYTTEPSFLCTGTSRVHGVSDTQDSSGDMGIICRSIGPSYGYVNAGVNSDTVSGFVASHTNRVAIADYCSHVIAEGPTNDDISVPATYQGNLQSMWGYFKGKGKKVYAVTCDPVTTGAWTLANQTDQTVSRNYESSVNPYLRANPGPLSGVFDITRVTATGVANKWLADGTVAKYTDDGIHETQFTNLAIQTAKVIDPTVFRVP
jgi:hypothetical protein